MKRLLLLLLAAVPARAAVLAERPAALARPVLSAPAAPVVPLAPSLLPAAAPAPAPAVAATETGLIRAPDVDAGLAALRAASHDAHPEVAAVVARINALRPELPIAADRLFLVRDPEALRALGIPEEAAGAARIVSDGRREVPVVILSAVRPVPLDAFVEYAVHEAVHLMDDGILRVRHDQELKHFFAEGWTQTRAVAMANEILADLGRPATPGTAYRREIALTEAFVARHGPAALDELVRTGSDAGLRRALGARWDLAARLISGDGAPRASRARRIEALTALILADDSAPPRQLK